MTNPLLAIEPLPRFDAINIADIVPAVTVALQESRDQIDAMVAGFGEGNAVTSASLLQVMGDIDDRLNSLWSPISHLNAVQNSDELREAYNACLPLWSEYSTWVGQHKALFEAYKSLQDSSDFKNLNQAQRKSVDNAVRDFTLSGIDLPDAKQQRFGDIKRRLSELSSQYGENVLDATQGWHKLITDVTELQGVPESNIEAFKAAAQAADQDGYRITLDIPCYLAVMTYCDNQALREELYQAFTTRASDQGPNGGQWDNAPLMDEILALRHELAQLLGFAHYADLSLATKMTTSTEQVMTFLNDLADKSYPVAQQELAELRAYCSDTFGVDTLQAWDIGYYSEKLKLDRYDVSQEALRPWFPVDKVLDGLFTIAGRLFGVTFAAADTSLWHSDARYFNVLKNGEQVAGFYLDLYARDNKRGGAWMADCRVRRRTSEGALQQPVAFLTCNFNGPVGDKPALLTHSEVTTLFHEFGHGLHHMLTTIEEGAVSGINGVPWDAVELPSQFLENWCWEREAIPLMSGHFETGEPLPSDMLDKLLAAKNFHSAMQMVRQLEFSLFDFRIHRDYKDQLDIHGVLQDVRRQVAVLQPPEFNRFENAFSHIFAGGYAAGYFSYKWAEVLSADAFSKFEEDGIFNADTGRSFLENILQQGGSQEPMTLFTQFRGREPSVEALLRHSGLLEPKAA